MLEAFGFIDAIDTSGFEKNGSNMFAHAHKDLSQGIEYWEEASVSDYPLELESQLLTELER